MDTTDLGFVRHWQAIAPILRGVEQDELRYYSEADRQRDIRALLDVPMTSPPSDSTGLIEQQRLFQRWR
jgi:hypothetical protein